MATKTGRARHMPAGRLAMAATVALGLGLGAWWALDDGGSELPGFVAVDERPLLPSLAAALDTIQIIVIEAEPDRVTLRRVDGAWHVAERGGYPARPGQVEAFMQGLAALEAVYVSRNDSPASAFHSEGERPTARVTLSDREGVARVRLTIGTSVATFREGAPAMMPVRLDDDPRIWMVAGAVEVSADSLAWTGRDVIDIPSNWVQSVALETPDGRRLAVSVDGYGFVSLAEGVVPEELQITGLVTAFKNIRFDDVRPADDSDDTAWRLRIQTDSLLALGYDLDIHPAGAGVWLTIAADANGRGAAEEPARLFNARHEGWEYRVEQFALEPLIRPEGFARNAAP